MSETTDPRQILLFDGVCNLCNAIVQFTIRNDPHAQFSFASLQSEAGQALLRKFGLRTDDFDSFVYIKGDVCYTRSNAGLHVLKDLGGFWRLAYGLIAVPRPLRDLIYHLIASSRYRIFGKRDSCMIPTPELKSRFLE